MHTLGILDTARVPGFPGTENNVRYTMMSYIGHPGENARFPSDPQLYDVAALQAYWGTGTIGLGNTVISDFVEPAGPDAGKDRMFAIWDASGTDTIDVSSVGKPALIDLRPGYFSSIGPDSTVSITAGQTPSVGVEGRLNISIAFGTYIENARGSGDNDLIIGNLLSNTLEGGGGADVIYGEGIDSIYDAGDADLNYRRIVTDGNHIADPLASIKQFIDNKTMQEDHLLGGAGDDYLQGGRGNDVIEGGDNNDYLIGGGGGDTFKPGSGSDTIWGDSKNADTNISGVSDIVDYSTNTFPITITFNGTTATPGLTVADGTGGTDTLHSVEKIMGTPQVDYLYYSGVVPPNYDLTIDFAGGNDDITNGGNSTTGLDYQIGSDNNGTLFNKDGTGGQIILQNVHSQIIASAHDDDITDLSEHDGMKRISGADGNDTITVDGSRAMLSGGDGNDVLTGGSLSDLLVSGAGHDELYGGGGTDLLTCDGGSSLDDSLLDGGDGADMLVARGDREIVTFRGGAGNDLIDGEGSAASRQMIFEAGDGHDTIVGDGYVGTPSFSTFYQETPSYGVDNISFAGLNLADVTIHWDMTIVAEDPHPPFTWGYIAIGDLAVVVNATGESVFFKNVAAEFITTGEAYSPGRLMHFQSFLVPELGFEDGGFTAAESTNVEIVIGDAGQYDVAGADYAAGQAGSVGNDTGASGDDYLSGGLGDDAISGGHGNDSFHSSGGSDTIDGGGGSDTLYLFGARSDFEITRNLTTGDITFEDKTGLEGKVTVRSVEQVYFATDNEDHAPVDLLTFTGTPDNDALVEGNTDDNLIYGLAGNDLLRGLAGNDVLDGGLGADAMEGGAGNDWYYVDNAADTVAEAAAAGSDRVFASASWTLTAGAEVELMSTANHAGTGAINLTGNALANLIYGNAGNNVLNGAAGADTLVGWAGNDWFYVDNGADAVSEAAGEGSDRVFASASWTLTAGAEVELMSTTNHAGTDAIDLTGNELANTIYGNAGANILDGKGGSDILVGNPGADTFAFTTALGAGNVDRIVDFSGIDDTMRLDDAIFTAIGGPGALNANAFVVGTAAADASDRLIYNSGTGQLYYDADGTGATAAILFATLDANPALTASDFLVI